MLVLPIVYKIHLGFSILVQVFTATHAAIALIAIYLVNCKYLGTQNINYFCNYISLFPIDITIELIVLITTTQHVG